MGIQQRDPEYLRAKYGFIRDLIQFHESRGTGLQCDPKINGKEVDLYLLYQIVTSHGGWEKINLRNEWDKLLEHFHLPRSTNGGLAIKQIYLKYLELYEKIHYLGEVDAKDDAEEEYEDYRRGRRYQKYSTSHHGHHHSSSSHGHHHHHHHQAAKEVTEQNRSQLGLSSRLLEASDYEGLLLSLQSPLPNEQDMAISVCTLLSNETKHVLRFSKSPAILNMLLAHAGIYQDCGMRLLMEETYRNRDGCGMDYTEFWDEVVDHQDAKQLLCECFVRRMHTSLGLTDDEGAILSKIQEIEDGNLPEEEKFAIGTSLRLKLARFRQCHQKPATPNEKVDPVLNTVKEVKIKEEKMDVDNVVNVSETETPVAAMTSTGNPDSPTIQEPESPVAKKPDSPVEGSVETPVEEITAMETDISPCSPVIESDSPKELVNGDCQSNDDCVVVSHTQEETKADNEKAEEAEVKCEPLRMCCTNCPCHRLDYFSLMFAEEAEYSIEKVCKENTKTEDDVPSSPNALPITLSSAHNPANKVGQRICQIAHILRNLSFEEDNATVMARSGTLMRFLLVAANCSFGSLPQTSFDIIGNICSYIQLEEPLRDPLTSMFLTAITSGVFSTDRFKVLRSLEALRELTKVEENVHIIARYVENRVYRRMCDLLTLSDIMLLIYTLECILSMTGLGEAVCDEIVRVQGSVATLVSLVTVEAQSYGPKGCILMRVVETVTGATTVTQTHSTTVDVDRPPTPQPAQQPVSLALNQSLGSPSQHLLQQQLQQPPIATPNFMHPIAARVPNVTTYPPPSLSPGTKFVTGTTTIVPPVHGLNHAVLKTSAMTSSTGVTQLGCQSSNVSQVFGNPTGLSNNLSSSFTQHATLMQTQSQYLTQNFPTPQQSMAMAKDAGTLHGNHALALPNSSIHSTEVVNASQIKIETTSNGNAFTNIPSVAGTLVGISQSKGENGTTNASGATSVASTTAQPVEPVNGATPVGGVIPNTLVTANLPQIANHTLNQHIVTPSLSLVSQRGDLSEEAWAVSWVKSIFEPTSGASIEQGEIYRMYSTARKNPNVVLSLEQFIQCVRCAFTSSVGPVIKNFGGGTSLSFFEGIKPRLAVHPAAATTGMIKPPGSNTTSITPNINTVPTIVVRNIQKLNTGVVVMTNPVQPSPQPFKTEQDAVGGLPQTNSVIPPAPIQEVEVSTEEASNKGNVVATATAGTAPTLPVSVHIPSREIKPSLSPILKATLSQPPKAKANNTTGSKKSKGQKGKDIKPGIKKGTGNTIAAGAAACCHKFKAAVSTSNAKGINPLSPSSSAIRSLLASKVAQRQQKKLQQQLPKNCKGKMSDATSEDGGYVSEVVKVNGVGPENLDKAEESSASSSILSSDGSDNSISTKTPSSITSFHGVLHNGQANMDLKNEMEGSEDDLKNKGPMKGMLVDLLERRLPSREPVNGMVTPREIRISDKGLELIDKLDDNSAASTIVNHGNDEAATNTSNPSTCTSNDTQEKMTFYSSTSDAQGIWYENQVTLQGQAPATACVIPAGTIMNNSLVGGVTLASGGAPNSSVTLRSGTCQQVKFCGGKIIRVIGESVSLGSRMNAPPAPSKPTIAEVQSAGLNVGDELCTSPPIATPSSAPNGDVTYVLASGGGVVGGGSAADICQSSVLLDVDSLSLGLNIISDSNAVVGSGERSVDTSFSQGDGIDNNKGEDGSDMLVDSVANNTDFTTTITTTSCNNNNDTSNSTFTEPNCSNGEDLLEKFSQFSDLIVVPPEQLGLKRASSPLPSAAPGNNSAVADDLPPPAKKQAIDRSVAMCTSVENDATSSVTAAPAQVATATVIQEISAPSTTTPNSVPVSTSATATASSLPPGSGAQVVQLPLRLSVNPQNPQQLTFTRQLVLPSGQQLLLSTGTSQQHLQGQVIYSKSQGANSDQIPKAIIFVQSHQQQNAGTNSQNSTVTPISTNTTSLPVKSGAQIRTIPASTFAALKQSGNLGAALQVPSSYTLAPVPDPNKKHITAIYPPSSKSLAKLSNQQTPTPNVRLPIPAGSITLGQNSVVHQVISPTLQNATQSLATTQNTTAQASTQSGSCSTSQQLIPSRPSVPIQFEGVKSSSYPHLTSDQLDLEFPYLCEWAGCGLRFLKPQQVSMHALKAHCPEDLVEAIRCEWGQNGCDPLLRKRFSAMTHLQDRHCSKQALEMALYRRKNKIEPPPVPQQPAHHPGYAPNAAFHAIKRHAMSFMNAKDLQDDNEGPVTKSIRLTSALILRNLVNYSARGRRMLQGYESHLSAIAMSNVESSRTIAQLLHDMNDQPKSSKGTILNFY